MTPGVGPSLSHFSMCRPRFETSQVDALEWLAEAHTTAETVIAGLGTDDRRAFGARLRKVIGRVACGPTRINRRAHVIPDVGKSCWDEGVIYDIAKHPHGQGTAARTRVYAEAVADYFERAYADEIAPAELIHVTCTGYASPSGAQRVVEKRGWGAETRVTHAYHMGCYAAFPALRMATGFLALPSAMQSRRPAGSPRRVDIVHTELCSLHLDPADHSLEQLVVQSLFADGMIRYSVSNDAPAADVRGLTLLALREVLVPDSSASMAWAVSDFGMAMTLAADVPDRIGAALKGFVCDLFADAGLDPRREIAGAAFAVHPGGPKIIDAVRDRLEITDAQVKTSRDVLFDYGNMSSATLPHVWMRMIDDPAIAVGTLVLSLAFGPGLTICGSLARKH